MSSGIKNSRDASLDMKQLPATHFSRAAEALIAEFRRMPDGAASRARPRATSAMSDLMASVSAKHQLGRVSVEHKLRENWPSLVGEANAGYSHPVQLDQRGKLTVIVTHSIVRSELMVASEIILKRIQTIEGCGGIKQLGFRLG